LLDEKKIKYVSVARTSPLVLLMEKVPTSHPIRR